MQPGRQYLRERWTTKTRTKNRARAVLLIMCVTALSGVASVEANEDSGAIVQTTERCRIVAYSVSPDGRQIAETRSCMISGIHMEDIAIRDLRRLSEPERVVFSSADLSSVRWIGAGEIAFVRTGQVSRVLTEDVAARKSHVVATYHRDVEIDGWSAQQKLMILSRDRAWRWNGRVSVRLHDSMSTLGLIAPQWARSSTETVTLLRIQGRTKADSVSIAPVMSHFSTLPQFQWRHRQLIGLVQSASSYRTRMFDMLTGRRVDRSVPLFDMDAFAVSRNGRIAVSSNHIWRSRPKATAGWGGSQRVYVIRRTGDVRNLSAFSNGEYLIDISGLWWAGNGDLIAQVMGSSERGGPLHWWLEEVDSRNDRLIRRFAWPGGDLGAIGNRCEFDRNRTVGVCVAQTLVSPPELVVFNVKTGAMHNIAEMNPAQQRLLVSFKDIIIRNRFGEVSTAYLAAPKDASTRPVPLAVMAYGFTQAYSKNAQWITSYPVAKLVRAGIAVCMVNWAHVPGLRADGFKDEMLAMRSDVSTLESAVAAVRQSGLNVSRAMILGWSFGGMFAARVIEHDPTFVAAQIGDPAEWDVTGYALGNEQWRVMSKWGMGGPPVGGTVANYVKLDPVGGGARPLGPVLLEFVSRHPAVGQLIQEWRGIGAKLEVFAYRRSVHWLNIPAEGRVSRKRNLYWAKLNLFGPGSVTKSELRSVGLTVPKNGWWNRKSR